MVQYRDPFTVDVCPLPEGRFPPRVDEYGAHQRIEWYDVFAALRFAVVSVRTTARGIAYGQAEKPGDNDDYVMFRHLLEQMLDGSYWH